MKIEKYTFGIVTSQTTKMLIGSSVIWKLEIKRLDLENKTNETLMFQISESLEIWKLEFWNWIFGNWGSGISRLSNCVKIGTGKW